MATDSPTMITPSLELHFARFIAGFGPDPGERIRLAAALLSRAAAAGDTCLDLAAIAGRPPARGSGDNAPVACPPLGEWMAALRASPAVGEPGQRSPLVLDRRGRLYLYRYWQYEANLAAGIRRLSEAPPAAHDPARLQAAIDRRFPNAADGRVDWQRVAAAVSVVKRFSVITGGPGTGKTFIIAKILAILSELARPEGLRVHLAAPTGKAAARLRESLQQAAKADAAPTAEPWNPEEVLTLHRMLKPIAGSPYFRHDRLNPLPTDMVVVDEASMVDLALMAKLVEALPPQAKLVLVGDKDQLASVEAGSVLGDICGGDRPEGVSAGLSEPLRQAAGLRLPPGAGPVSGLAEAIVELRRSFRFAEASPIGELSRAVNRGDARAALDLLSSAAGTPVQWWDPDRHAGLEQRIEELVIEGCQGCCGRPDPAAALHSFGRFRILCALRAGPQGVDAVNRMAERTLSRRGLIRGGGAWGGLWYPGRPVLVTRNDYAVNLYNGDMGVALAEVSGGRESLMVFFQGASGALRRLPPYRLGEHETAYAMTVHKSQGSEFDDVLLVLPDRDSPVLTRELIYTALTRSRRSITIRARKPVLLAAIGRRIERASGLRSALWGG